MISKVEALDLQFTGSTDTEQKLRRLMDSLRKTQRALNSLIDSVSTLSSVDPAAISDHVLASTSGLGAHHTVAGLTAGQVLIASSPNNAKFRAFQLTDIVGTDLGSPANLDIIQYLDGYPTWRPLPTFTATVDTTTIDHGDLLGLADDDHPQYQLRGQYSRNFLLMGT